MFKFDQMTNLGPNYNVAPTHELPIVHRKQDDRRNELAIARWGFVANWRRTRHSLQHSTQLHAFSEMALRKASATSAVVRARRNASKNANKVT